MATESDIDRIRERVRGALTGSCGERELKEHALADLELLLDEMASQEVDHAEELQQLQSDLDDEGSRRRDLENEVDELRGQLEAVRKAVA